MDVNITYTVCLYVITKMYECEESVFFLVCAVPLQFSAVKSCWVASYHKVSWLCELTRPGTLEIHFFMTHLMAQEGFIAEIFSFCYSLIRLFI